MDLGLREGQRWVGAIYVATPGLLAAFHISPAEVLPAADILSMRPGLAGAGHLQLTNNPGAGNGGPGTAPPCTTGACIDKPVIQHVPGLPSGTDAPNTLITLHAIRQSETAGDLQVLAATGASSWARRSLSAATAGGLALLGAVLGTVAGYVGMIGWLRSNSLAGGLSALGNVPVANLLVILLGMPAVAVALGWLLAGRERPATVRRAVE
jgi:hypothetical protein